MTYYKRTLTRTGSINKLAQCFDLYCKEIGVQPEVIKTGGGKAVITEAKKVFIGAMILKCNEPCFGIAISEVLGLIPASTCRMISEVKFRVRKDDLFHEKVNNILDKINNNEP